MTDDNLQLTDLEPENLNGILQTSVNEKSEIYSYQHEALSGKGKNS